MPSQPHEVLVVALREEPSLLRSLVRALRGATLPPGQKPRDSTVRSIKAIEVRPDILFIGDDDEWTMVEVQHAIDKAKQRRWLLAMSTLFDQMGTFGDLVVITPHRSVAKWARGAAHVRTSRGTSLRLDPIVLCITAKECEALLDEAYPELALVAAWAMQRRRGPEARAIVERAIEVTSSLSEPLRRGRHHAILSVLSEPMLRLLEGMTMNPDKFPESPRVRAIRLAFEEQGRKKGIVEGRAEGETKGKQDALLTLLHARSIALSPADEARVRACHELPQLDTWIALAATASSLGEVLGPAPKPAPASRARRAPRLVKPKAAKKPRASL